MQSPSIPLTFSYRHDGGEEAVDTKIDIFVYICTAVDNTYVDSYARDYYSGGAVDLLADAREVCGYFVAEQNAFKG